MEKARGKGVCDWQGRASLESNNLCHASIVFSCIIIVHVQVCINIALSSYKVQAVLGCSSGLLILRDSGAIVLASHNMQHDRSSHAVREASTVHGCDCAVGSYLNQLLAHSN